MSCRCSTDTELVARTEDGRFLDYGRKQRTAPPSLRRALLAYYNQMCGADGCDSNHRLQVHHLIPWAEGGETNQQDLVVLCWLHHQIVVHERGFEIVFPFDDRRRIRFKPPQGKRRTTQGQAPRPEPNPHPRNSIDTLSVVVLPCRHEMVIHANGKEVTDMTEPRDVSALDMSIVASRRTTGPKAQFRS